MVRGKIYIGIIHEELVKYLGVGQSEDDGRWLHQFEFIKPNEYLIGYSQTDIQVLREKYIEVVAGTVLYGQP